MLTATIVASESHYGEIVKYTNLGIYLLREDIHPIVKMVAKWPERDPPLSALRTVSCPYQGLYM